MINIYEDNSNNNNYHPIQDKVLLKYNPFMKKMKKYHSFIKQKMNI